MSARFVADDSGMSMVELIVAAAISAVLLGLLASIFGGSLIAQQQSTERNGATMQLNAATASITESVRNASEIQVAPSGLRLDAKVLSLDGTWSCRAWQVEGGALRYSEGATARPTADDTVQEWPSLTSGEGSTVAGTLTSAAAFDLQPGAWVSLGLALTQNETTVAVTDGAIAQVVQTGGPACW